LRTTATTSTIPLQCGRPTDRKLVELGTLALISTPAEQVKAQKALLFNPLALQAGIEPSADPVLLARPATYGVSYGQRAQ